MNSYSLRLAIVLFAVLVVGTADQERRLTAISYTPDGGIPVPDYSK